MLACVEWVPVVACASLCMVACVKWFPVVACVQWLSVVACVKRLPVVASVQWLLVVVCVTWMLLSILREFGQQLLEYFAGFSFVPLLCH